MTSENNKRSIQNHENDLSVTKTSLKVFVFYMTFFWPDRSRIEHSENNIEGYLFLARNNRGTFVSKVTLCVYERLVEQMLPVMSHLCLGLEAQERPELIPWSYVQQPHLRFLLFVKALMGLIRSSWAL